VETQYKSDAEFERAAGLSPKITDKWRRGSKSYVKYIPSIAKALDVTSAYLLCEVDMPAPQELAIPEVLKDVPVAFHRGEFEGLTQDEVDALARIATELKALRQE